MSHTRWASWVCVPGELAHTHVYAKRKSYETRVQGTESELHMPGPHPSTKIPAMYRIVENMPRTTSAAIAGPLLLEGLLLPRILATASVAE